MRDTRPKEASARLSSVEDRLASWNAEIERLPRPRPSRTTARDEVRIKARSKRRRRRSLGRCQTGRSPRLPHAQKALQQSPPSLPSSRPRASWWSRPESRPACWCRASQKPALQRRVQEGARTDRPPIAPRVTAAGQRFARVAESEAGSTRRPRGAAARLCRYVAGSHELRESHQPFDRDGRRSSRVTRKRIAARIGMSRRRVRNIPWLVSSNITGSTIDDILGESGAEPTPGSGAAGGLSHQRPRPHPDDRAPNLRRGCQARRRTRPRNLSRDPALLGRAVVRSDRTISMAQSGAVAASLKATLSTINLRRHARQNL